MVLIDELEDLTFCRGLAPEHLGLIARAAWVQEQQACAVLFHEGRESPYVYLLLAGEVSLEIDVPGQGPLPVQDVGAGELLGWSPLLGLGPMTATARTTTPCRLAALRAAELQALIKEDLLFGEEFLRRVVAALSQRIRALRLEVLESRRLLAPASE